MRILTLGLGLLATLLMGSTSFAAECGDPPAAPIIPDGKTATLDELKATSAAIKEFVGTPDQKGSMETYLDCLDGNREAEFELMNQDQQARWNEDFQAMDDERMAVADRFNEQARIWQARKKKDEDK